MKVNKVKDNIYKKEYRYSFLDIITVIVSVMALLYIVLRLLI